MVMSSSFRSSFFFLQRWHMIDWPDTHSSTAPPKTRRAGVGPFVVTLFSSTAVQPQPYGHGGSGMSAPMKMCGVDGTSCPIRASDGTWRVWIGGDPHYRRFHGCIDEVKVFSKRLSPDEVDAFGMQGHWHLVEFFTN